MPLNTPLYATLPYPPDVAILLQRYTFADDRWDKAVSRRGYPFDDEPETSAADGHPHTEKQTRMVLWADAWRTLFHELESALLAHPYVRHGLLEGVQRAPPEAQHENGIGFGLVAWSVASIGSVA